MPFLPSLTGNEQMTYDMSRAHSADILFFKVRAIFWGATFSFISLLVGNILGVFDVNIIGWLLDKVIGYE